MKSLKNQQSPVKNQKNNPQCVLYSTVAAIEEYLIKIGKPQILDENIVEKESEKLIIEWKVGDAYTAGTVDKALVWAKELIGDYKWIKKEEIKNWIDKECSVIVSLNGYTFEGRILDHNVLITGYDDGYEYKNSWGESWGNKGYGYLKNADLKYITEPCYVIADNKIELIKPVDAPITQGYGENVAYYNTKALGYTLGHPGIDFGCPVGTAVRSASDGVLKPNRTIAGALVMTVQHDFGTTEYWHLSETFGFGGDKVKQGQIICLSGNSGKYVIGNGHLHFELHPNIGGNPQMNGTIDPSPLFVTSNQLKQSDIDSGLQKVLKNPIPVFPWYFGIEYLGGRIKWALEHRRIIFNLYLRYFNRIPEPWECDFWLVRRPNSNEIEKGFKESEEYNKLKL